MKLSRAREKLPPGRNCQGWYSWNAIKLLENVRHDVEEHEKEVDSQLFHGDLTTFNHNECSCHCHLQFLQLMFFTGI